MLLNVEQPSFIDRVQPLHASQQKWIKQMYLCTVCINFFEPSIIDYIHRRSSFRNFYLTGIVLQDIPSCQCNCHICNFIVIISLPGHSRYRVFRQRYSAIFVAQLHLYRPLLSRICQHEYIASIWVQEC